MLLSNPTGLLYPQQSDISVAPKTVLKNSATTNSSELNVLSKVVDGFWRELLDSKHPTLRRLFNGFKDKTSFLVDQTRPSTWKVTIPQLLFSVSHSAKGRSALFDFLRSFRLTYADVCVCPVRNQDLLPKGSSILRDINNVPLFLDGLSIEKAYLWLRSVANCALDGDYHQSENNTLKLLTYNVCGLPNPLGTMECSPTRFYRIGRELRNLSADIVGLQEMWESSTSLVLHSSHYPHRFSEFEVESLKRTSMLGRSGLALLSKYPMYDCEMLTFSSRSGLEKMVKKGAVYARVHTPLGQIDVYNVHLASEPERLNKLFVSANYSTMIRAEQLRELKSWIEQRSRPNIPVYVMGDFNFTEDDNLYRSACRFLGDDIFRTRFGYPQSGDSEDIERSIIGATFDPANNQYALSPRGCSERLDYVWCKYDDSAHHLYGAERVFVKRPLSDHFGVLITIKEEH